MKYFFAIMGCCCALLLSGLSFAENADTKGLPLDKVVAIVNNEVITQSELNKAMVLAERQMQDLNTPVPPVAKLRLQVLNQLIDHKIELQTADRMGIKVTDDQVDQAISNIAVKNNMTLPQLKAALAGQHIVYAEYKKQIKEQMIIQQLLQHAVGGSITITDQDIKNAASLLPPAAIQKNNEYHVRDILIALPDHPSAADLKQANEKAMQIKLALQKGQDFDAAAMTHSEGQEAAQGGDLGWRTLSGLPPVFATAVLQMKVGEIAGPIQTGNGLHLIKLESVKSNTVAHTLTQTNVRHILIKTNLPADDQPAKQELESLRQQLMHGASFAVLAKKYSQDIGSAQKGGDLGWVSPGFLVPPFEQAMNGLAINQISEPVKTQYGWHLIQVLGRRTINDDKDYQKNQIRQMIYMREFNQNAAIWVQELRHESYIKIMN